MYSYIHVHDVYSQNLALKLVNSSAHADSARTARRGAENGTEINSTVGYGASGTRGQWNPSAVLVSLSDLYPKGGSNTGGKLSKTG